MCIRDRCTNLENQRHAWDNNLKKAKHGEQHGASKLTKNQVNEIINDERKQNLIAKEYNICQQTVSKIKSKKTWSIYKSTTNEDRNNNTKN